MDNKYDLDKHTEIKPPLSSSHMQGFQGNGAFYQELAPTKQKRDLRINASISSKTFGRLIFGFIGLSAAGLVAVIVLILKLISG